MRTTTGLSRRQVGATRRAGTFLGVSRAFVSSGLPERAPGGGEGGAGAGMACARRMDENPNPGENEEPRTRLGRFSPSGLKKRATGGLVGFTARNALTTPRTAHADHSYYRKACCKVPFICYGRGIS
jgi:hypothetical protein